MIVLSYKRSLRIKIKKQMRFHYIISQNSAKLLNSTQHCEIIKGGRQKLILYNVHVKKEFD